MYYYQRKPVKLVKKILYEMEECWECGHKHRRELEDYEIKAVIKFKNDKDLEDLNKLEVKRFKRREKKRELERERLEKEGKPIGISCSGAPYRDSIVIHTKKETILYKELKIK